MPLTVGGKIVTMLYAVFYVPLFLYVMTLIYQNNIERLRAKDREHDMRIEEIREDIHEVEADVNAIIENTVCDILPNKKTPKKKSPTQ